VNIHIYLEIFVVSIKVSITRTWTTIPNEILNDRSLPPDSLGLFCYLASKPNDWDISAAHLTRRFNCGRARIYRMLKDLRNSGYATYTRHVDGTTDWVIGNHQPPETVATQPYAEKPDMDNQHDIVKKERAVSTEKPYGQTGFDRWWGVYPKKVKKKDARVVWNKNKLAGKAQILYDDTLARLQSDRWKRGYVPDPTTYLRGERWNDELVIAGPESISVPRDEQKLVAFAQEHGIQPARPGESLFDFHARVTQTIGVSH
jgi:hypothetical protein